MRKYIKLKYPLVLKLFVVITSTLFVALGVIISLSYFFIHSSIKDTQEMNNRLINNSAAAFVTSSFNDVYADARYLMLFLKNTDYAIDWSLIGNIAAMCVLKKTPSNADYSASKLTAPPPMKTTSRVPFSTVEFNYQKWEFDNLYINDSFFEQNNCDNTAPMSFFSVPNDDIYREAETNVVIFDASKNFGDLTILAMRIASADAVCFVFFSAEDIANSFSAGANASILLDDSGDPLIVPNDNDYRNGKVSAGRRLYNGLQIRKIRTGAYVYGSKKGFFAIQNIIIGDADNNSCAVVTQIDQDIVFESIVNTTLRNIYLGSGVWFLSIIIVWFFSLGISTPLLKLSVMSSRIEEGDYATTLKIVSKDETGLLIHTMNNLSNALGNFERFTNKTIARLARMDMLPIGGEDKNATFFFSDIRSFTAISEKLTPTEVISFLNDYMERMVACVLATNGAIDKFIGDAVMAHWGAVESSGTMEDDAINGVRAALMMRASLASFNEGRGQTPDKPIIKIGCGLNSGAVVAGLIGTEQKIVYTVIGDAVSFADRCETFNKAFGTQIVISEYTYNLLQDKFITEEMKTVHENGVAVKTYAVINIKDPILIKKTMFECSTKIPKMNMEIAAQCVGPDGPQTLSDLRKLLDIPYVDLRTVNVDEEEKKYAVSK